MKTIKLILINILILLTITNNTYSQNTLYDHAKILLDSLIDEGLPEDTVRFAVLADPHWYNADEEYRKMFMTILNPSCTNIMLTPEKSREIFFNGLLHIF